jgi:hypothetical protein
MQDQKGNIRIKYRYWCTGTVPYQSKYQVSVLLNMSRAMLRTRDVYPGSQFFPTRIPDTHQRIKVF